VCVCVCGFADHSCPDRAWQRLSQRLSGEIASPLGTSPPVGGPVGPARALVIFGGNVWWHLCWLADWFYDIFGLTVSLGMRGRARDARSHLCCGWLGHCVCICTGFLLLASFARCNVLTIFNVVVVGLYLLGGLRRCTGAVRGRWTKP
jgi:hypothetical protein